jgi:hypothetical protein
MIELLSIHFRSWSRILTNDVNNSARYEKKTLQIKIYFTNRKFISLNDGYYCTDELPIAKRNTKTPSQLINPQKKPLHK